MNILTFIGAAAVLFAQAAPAKAVDVTNEQDTEIQLTISDSEGSELVNIAAGETVPNLCEKCKIVLGDEAVSAEGGQTAVIRGGRITLRAD